MRFTKRKGFGHRQPRRLQRLQQAEFVARNLRIPRSVGFTVSQKDEALYTLSARNDAQGESASADLFNALQLPARIDPANDPLKIARAHRQPSHCLPPLQS